MNIKFVSVLQRSLHIQNHEEPSERHVNHLNEHINWQEVRAQSVLKLASQNNLIIIKDGFIELSEKGAKFTNQAIQYITDNERSEIEQMKDELFLFRG